MKRIFSIETFGGPVTGVDPRALTPNGASDSRNVILEDGTITVRRGFRNIVAAQASFSAGWGLNYLQGYSGTTEVEEYISFEALGGNTKPWSRNVTTGVATEVKNGVTSLNLNASTWVASAFQGDSYAINPLNTPSVYRHTIGDLTSFVPMSVPTPPSVAMTYAILYGTGPNAYTQYSFAGIDPAAEVAYTGTAHATDSTTNSDGSISIGHTVGSNRAASFEIDLNGATAGKPDYTYNDIFAFTLGMKVSAFDIADLTFTYTNDDGTPKVMTPTKMDIILYGGPRPPGIGGNYYGVRVQFDDKTRADWDNIRKLKLTYTVSAASSTASQNVLTLFKPFIGAIDESPPVSREPNQGLLLNYSYYYSSPSLESGLSETSQLFVPTYILRGSNPIGGLAGLGVHLKLTMTVSADANVDNYRIYVQDTDGNWRRLATQSDATATYDYKISWVEVLRLTAYTPNPFTFTGVTNAFQYRGSMVWLYSGGYQNVRFSRIGSPEAQATLTDSADDPARGATFSLANNFGDEPLFGVQAGDAAIIAGKLGVHAMVGSRPSEMTPPKQVPGSFGVAGKFAGCRWQDDNGQPGMAYVSREGQVYFVLVAPQFSGDEGSQVVEISASIRTGADSLRTYLIDGQPLFGYTDFSGVRCWVDDATNSLWVALGRRALVYRRPNLADGQRHWEPYEYETGSSTTSIAYVAASTKRRVRLMRSNGKFDEMEWNSSTGAFIEGSLRDGGAAMPGGTIYWQSHTFVGAPRRLKAIKVVRDDYTDVPTVTSYSTGDGFSGFAVLMTSGSHSAMFPITCIGGEHFYRVSMSEGDEPIRRLEIEEFAAGGNRNR